MKSRQSGAGFVTLEKWLGEYDCLFLRRNNADPLVLLPWRSSADTAARDCGIVFSIALQHGADLETIRRALCRNSQGRASGPIGAALDAIAEAS